MDENMTPEEEKFARDNKTYGLYGPFFDAMYFEFRQQTRKRPDELLNGYKAETLNKVLRPLREMMQGEEYAELLGPVIAADEDGHADYHFYVPPFCERHRCGHETGAPFRVR